MSLHGYKAVTYLLSLIEKFLSDLHKIEIRVGMKEVDSEMVALA